MKLFQNRDRWAGLFIRGAPMKTLLITAALGGLVAGMAQAETLRFPHGVGYAGSELLDPISPQRFYEMNQTLYSAWCVRIMTA